MVRQILICHSISEYVTLSWDSIRFWRQTDLQFRGLIGETGLFAVMAIFDGSREMAVATSSRRFLVHQSLSARSADSQLCISETTRRFGLKLNILGKKGKFSVKTMVIG
jgi:hypothetical protein